MMNFVQPSAEFGLAGNPSIGAGGSGAMAGNAWDAPGALPSLPADGVGLRGWAANPTAGAAALGGLPPAGGMLPGGAGTFGGQGGFLGVLSGIINQITNLINQYTGEGNAEGPGTQTVSDGTFTSTGDPHLSENATILNAAGNSQAVNQKFDSMNGHANLLSSQDFDGGFRLSTTVTAPNANGVTMNASATVHMNSNLDNITLNNDGSIAISSDGSAVSVGTGQSVTLGGGETVTHNADGSLTVAATNPYGGSITTTLAAKAGGVDVSATVRNATVGGDIASGNAAGSAAPVTASPIGDANGATLRGVSAGFTPLPSLVAATNPGSVVENELASATLAPTPNPSSPLGIGNDFEQFAANA